MLATDDTRADGVYRQADYRFLPKRLDAMRRRVAQLERGWDVNLLALLVDDAAELARDLAVARDVLRDMGTSGMVIWPFQDSFDDMIGEWEMREHRWMGDA